MIAGAVKLDLSREPEGDQLNRDRRLLQVLDLCPDGARVVVDIGSRQYVSQDAAHWLHKHDHRLQIEVIGTDPAAVLQFVLAGRAGDWSVTG
jgi:hypothetical protein